MKQFLTIELGAIIVAAVMIMVFIRAEFQGVHNEFRIP